MCEIVKDVHKAPALDLVGWYTILPASGPQLVQLPIHRQILDSYNESAILLGFHPTAVIEGPVGGKLPLTIYESNYESEESPTEPGEDKEMKDGESQLSLKFKELPYSVETGEAEMISIDFVARGGGNATAVAAGPIPLKKADGAGAGKGKSRALKKAEGQESDFTKVDHLSFLTREDEELIASLTAKANAVKMLHARLDIIAAYLKNLPPSYISNATPSNAESSIVDYTPVNHSILRSIEALLSRLSLLIPADAVAFEQEMLSEKNDVDLVSLLSVVTKSIKDIRDTGRKYSLIETGKHAKAKGDIGRSWGVPDHVSGAGDLLA
jgi:COP9 signalosome complex subunit 6